MGFPCHHGYRRGGECRAAGRYMANGGAAAAFGRLRADDQDGPPGKGVHRPPHPRRIPGHERPISGGEDKTHAREHRWVDLPAGRGGRVTAGEVNSVGGKSGLRRAGRWVTPSRGDPKESATESYRHAALISGEATRG